MSGEKLLKEVLYLLTKLNNILNLGEQPPANSLYKVGENGPPNVPLRLVFCKECSTVQLGENVNPEYLFSEYLWTTGTSDTAVKYSEQFAEKALNHINHLANESFVIEIRFLLK